MRKESFFQKHGLIIYFFSMIIFSGSILGFFGVFSTSPPVVCAENCTGGYEIYDNTPAFCDLNPINCFNTIDDCKDGSLTIDNVRQGSPYEWVNNITITNGNKTNFTGGDVIDISVSFKCDYTDDGVSFVYNNGTEWVNIFNANCVEDFIDDFTYSLTLDKINGNHSIRAVVAYLGPEGMVCGNDYDPMYSDTDDVSFFVYSDYETNPPIVSNPIPAVGTIFDFILPKTFVIKADIFDDMGIQNVTANISWANFTKTINLTKYLNNTYMGEFLNANITGRYNVSFTAIDINNNVNNSLATYFFFSDNNNITINSPINEEWYPLHSVVLDFFVDEGFEVMNSWYILNENNYTINPFTYYNNISENTPIFINNSLGDNISQSFNLTGTMNLKKLILKAKRYGEGDNISIQLRNDSGGIPGAVISNIVFNTSNISNSSVENIEIMFDIPIKLYNETKYWIDVQQNSSNTSFLYLEINNASYLRGDLLLNPNLDILFVMYDAYRFYENISIDITNNLSAYANMSSSSIWSSPEIIFYVDEFGPEITDVLYAPLSQAELDPEKNINITAKITDMFNVSTAVLEYWASDNIKFNKTMYYDSGLYKSNFTPISEDNWSFRIYSNDTLGNYFYSNSTMIEVNYEESYTVNLSLFNSTSGGILDNNISIGSIIIKNTGDLNISFDLDKSNTTIPKIYFDNLNTSSFTLTSNSSYKTNITATTLTFQSESNIEIIITPAVNNSLSSTIVSGKIISGVNGAYYIVSITKYDSDVTIGDSRIILEAEVINAGNETAKNTSLTWILPAGWTSKENISKNIGDLLVGQKYIFTINTNVGSTAPTGTKTITFTANNGTINKSDSKSVNVVLASAPTTTTKSGETKQVVSYVSQTSFVEIGTPEIVINIPSDIQMIRGENVSFNITLSNDESKNISNISIEMEGIPKEYSLIFPSVIPVLESKQNITLRVTLNPPLYYSEGTYNLVLKVKTIWKSKELVFDEPFIITVLEKDISDIFFCLDNASKSINLLKSQFFNVDKLNEYLETSKLSLVKKDYVGSKINCLKILELVSSAKNIKDGIEEIVDSSSFINSESFDESLNLVKNAFDDGDYELAASLIQDTQTLLQLNKERTSYKIRMLSETIKKYWVFIIAFFMTSMFLIYLMYSRFSIDHCKNNITKLGSEKELIHDLIKDLQKEHYSKKNISSNIYKTTMDKYLDMIAKINREQSQSLLRIYALQGKSKNDNVRKQFEMIKNLKEKLQKDYYQNKNINTDAYNKMLNEYNDALSSIEEGLKLESK